jgi:HEAT repeat protein
MRPGYTIQFLLLFVVLAGPSAALAQMTGNVDKLKADLHGDNLDRAVAASSALGSLKEERAMEALMGALQLGAPPKLTLALIEALGMHKSPKSIGLLRHFAVYRRPKVRVAALRAMSGIDDRRVGKILIKALGDSSPMVRAMAARELGERKDRRAERPLFKMLKRGDRSAAGPLGVVGGVETAKQLAELIGELPDPVLATALGTIVKRKDFGPDPLRKEVVKALCKIPGADATAALVEYIASVPAKEKRLSKMAAEKCLEARQK